MHMSVFVYMCVHKYAHLRICRVHTYVCGFIYLCVYIHLYVTHIAMFDVHIY